VKKITYLLLFCSALIFSQTTYDKDKEAILTVLKAQQEAWNNYNIEAFMEGYWKSDELTFYGSGGVIKGWQATLDRYKKSYPSAAHFGTLNFKFNEIAPISEDSYYVMGEYFLTRSVGDTNGIFMLVLKRINGEWKVVADTSAKVK
jgi:hypothetical protein